MDYTKIGRTSSSQDQILRIPSFNLEEKSEISQIFESHNIEYEITTVHTGADPFGGSHDFIFLVTEPQFFEAIRLIKELFGIGVQAHPTFTGACPACQSHVTEVVNCSECGLTLAGDNSNFYKNHVFYKFLEIHDLL